VTPRTEKHFDKDTSVLYKILVNAKLNKTTHEIKISTEVLQVLFSTIFINPSCAAHRVIFAARPRRNRIDRDAR
jgi:hypothetical protein